MNRHLLLLTIILIFSTPLFSQNVAINNTGDLPDSSSILDIQSKNKGVLVPRMTDTLRKAIAFPATGLVVYQTNEKKGFYFNYGTPANPIWMLLAQENLTPLVDAGNDTTKSVFTPDSVRLNGKATDIDGKIVGQLWSQISGPNAAIITNSGSALPVLSNIISGKYVFQFMATDEKGATGVDTVSLTFIVKSLATGLIAYYPFTNNFNDVSGNGNNGAVTNAGGSLTSDNKGVPNAAFNVNGNGQELLVSNNGKIKFDSSFSFSFNCMPRDYGRYMYLAMINYQNGYGNVFGVSTGIPGNKNLYFSVANLNAPCNDYVQSNQTSSTLSNFIPQPGVWNNYVCTFNKGVKKIYVNGILIQSEITTDKAVKVCLEDQLIIGGWWSYDTGASLNGKIDEVRIYNRELANDEIMELSKDFR